MCFFDEAEKQMENEFLSDPASPKGFGFTKFIKPKTKKFEIKRNLLG